MRVKSMLAAAAALALGAGAAEASFVITATVTPGTGNNAGRTLIQFNAQGTGGSTNLLSVDASLTADANLWCWAVRCPRGGWPGAAHVLPL